MLRTVKAKNARSKRALDKKQPKVVENVKKALFVPGSNANQLLHDLMVDLAALKKPDVKRFSRKNEVRPFEDASSIEFFSEKNDASLIVVATNNKKRPNNLTFVRLFNFQVYDMIELRAANVKVIDQFKSLTVQVGLKPMFTFNGGVFDTHPVYQHIKSLFLDFYRGQEVDLLDPASLQHVISISAEDVKEDDGGNEVLPTVYFRVYLLKTYKSNTPKVPRVELQEIGPRVDFTVGRRQGPTDEMEKMAMKQRKIEAKTKKNIETDLMGDKIGRIHMQKQDLGKLQVRKMKGLKRKFDEIEEEEDVVSGEEDDFGGFDSE